MNNLGAALERPLISLSGPSAKSATHPAARNSWSLCAIRSRSYRMRLYSGRYPLYVTRCPSPHSVRLPLALVATGTRRGGCCRARGKQVDRHLSLGDHLRLTFHETSRIPAQGPSSTWIGPTTTALLTVDCRNSRKLQGKMSVARFSELLMRDHRSPDPPTKVNYRACAVQVRRSVHVSWMVCG